MLSNMIFFADLLCQLICLFCFKRYVFLEYGLERKKQHLYFLVSVLLALLCGTVDENIAMILGAFLLGLNISLARKKHRVSGFFLVIPIAGIANGLVIPILSMSIVLFSSSEIAVDIYRLLVDILIGALLLFFSAYYEKRQMDKQIKMGNRHLRKWELGLLCFVGILMMGFSNIVSILSFGIPIPVSFIDIQTFSFSIYKCISIFPQKIFFYTANCQTPLLTSFTPICKVSLHSRISAKMSHR